MLVTLGGGGGKFRGVGSEGAPYEYSEHSNAVSSYQADLRSTFGEGIPVILTGGVAEQSLLGSLDFLPAPLATLLLFFARLEPSDLSCIHALTRRSKVCNACTFSAGVLNACATKKVYNTLLLLLPGPQSPFLPTASLLAVSGTVLSLQGRFSTCQCRSGTNSSAVMGKETSCLIVLNRP